MILVDTSVWIEHLRKGNPTLSALLDQNHVVIHPWIMGELACGNLRNRSQLLRLWQSLDLIPDINREEALYFIGKEKGDVTIFNTWADTVVQGFGAQYVNQYEFQSSSMNRLFPVSWLREQAFLSISSSLSDTSCFKYARYALHPF